VAADAKTGEIAWKSVLGLRPFLPEDKQLTGNSCVAGPRVTAGGLVFIGATTDQRFRAFDAKTGEQLWVTELKANAENNPMSYRGPEGKQYVAMIALNRLLVYALP
jgi:quinoprotein glucose dehydrogenase